MKKKFLIISGLVIYCLQIQPQDIHHLTLEESIEIAKEQSYSMLKLRQDLKIAEYNLKSATSSLKTHIDLSLTAPNYTEGIESSSDINGVLNYYPNKRMEYSGGLSVRQPLPTNGNIYLENDLSTRKSMSKEYDVKDDSEINIRQRYTSLKTRLRLNQPLDALYGYNSIKSSLKKAELDYERTNKQLKREELRLIYQVSNTYYSLLSRQKRSEIAYLNLERQAEAHDISQKKFEAGLIREVDALQMEVDLAQAQNDYDISLVNQVSTRNSFKELLGINLSDSIILNNNLSYNVVLVDVEKAVEMAMKNRLEIREQEIQIELQRMNIKQQKAEGMIKASLNAYIEKEGINPQGRDENNLPTSNIGFNRTLDQAFTDYKDRPVNYSIGFTIKAPIFDWGENRAKVRATQARLKQIEYTKEEIERGIETEVRNLVASTNSELKRLQLLEKNVTIAEKSFEITRQRYSDGDIDSQALALERDRLNKAYTSHLDAYIAYQLSLADLIQKTFYDFRKQKAVE